MKMVLLLLVNLVVSSSFGQLKCKEIKLPDNSLQTKCFHQNGQISVIETWDKDRRFGTVSGYNQEGKELFFHDLRNVGGHASVQLEYFPNGQLSKVYYSDAPDGGIQFYNSTTRFDENGVQTEFYETTYPQDNLKLVVEELPKEMPVKEAVKDTSGQEVVQCAAIHSTIYQFQNATGLRLRIVINPLPNNVVSRTQKEVIVQPFQTINFDTVLMAGQFILAEIYQPEVLKLGTKPKKNKKVTIIQPGPLDSGTTRTYYWFVVRKEDAVKMNSSRGW